ncbi:MAG TPA: preprotein translocase subunit SecE [Gammaproteobacteria bacterium]|nr:preprotein translocase subunit SecE [Gammaproteobacteria bacterium]
MADKIKLSLAALILLGAVAAFYVLGEYPLLYRVLGLLAAAGLSALVALQSEAGRNARDFLRGSMVEIRKVVWPTRKETTQTTLIVIIMVIIMGILLWLLDMFLLWAVRLLTGQGA